MAEATRAVENATRASVNFIVVVRKLDRSQREGRERVESLGGDKDRGGKRVKACGRGMD